MRISYKPLFSIECLHGYFADRVCRALTLSPTAAGARLCERHHLRFRPSRWRRHGLLRRVGVESAAIAGRDLAAGFRAHEHRPVVRHLHGRRRQRNAAPGATVRYFSNREEHVAEIERTTPLAAASAGSAVRAAAAEGEEQPFHLPVRSGGAGRCRPGAERRRSSRSGRRKRRNSQVRDWPIRSAAASRAERYQFVIAGRPAGDFYLSDEPAVSPVGRRRDSPQRHRHRPEAHVRPSRSPAARRSGVTTSSISRRRCLHMRATRSSACAGDREARTPPAPETSASSSGPGR